jgi:hypothetical protein
MIQSNSKQDSSGNEENDNSEIGFKFRSTTPLNTISSFSEEAINVFKSYWIENLGQLLSSTKGLSLDEVFKEIPDGKILLQDLKKAIPCEVLEFHKDYFYDKPTGYIIREEADKQSENDSEEFKPGTNEDDFAHNDECDETNDKK